MSVGGLLAEGGRHRQATFRVLCIGNADMAGWYSVDRVNPDESGHLQQIILRVPIVGVIPAEAVPQQSVMERFGLIIDNRAIQTTKASNWVKADTGTFLAAAPDPRAASVNPHTESIFPFAPLADLVFMSFGRYEAQSTGDTIAAMALAMDQIIVECQALGVRRFMIATPTQCDPLMEGGAPADATYATQPLYISDGVLPMITGDGTLDANLPAGFVPYWERPEVEQGPRWFDGGLALTDDSGVATRYELDNVGNAFLRDDLYQRLLAIWPPS